MAHCKPILHQINLVISRHVFDYHVNIHHCGRSIGGVSLWRCSSDNFPAEKVFGTSPIIKWQSKTVCIILE